MIGDRPRDDCLEEVPGSQCAKGFGKGYQPVTTKAGSRLWSIGFAEPAGLAAASDADAVSGTVNTCSITPCIQNIYTLPTLHVH